MSLRTPCGELLKGRIWLMASSITSLDITPPLNLACGTTLPGWTFSLCIAPYNATPKHVRGKTSALVARVSTQRRPPYMLGRHSLLSNAVSDIRRLKRNNSNVLLASHILPFFPRVSRCLANGPARMGRSVPGEILN